MVFQLPLHLSYRVCFLLAAFLLVPPAAYSQITLTGAIQFSTNSAGAASGGQVWNTLGGDRYDDLWLALNSNATSPVNGPGDEQAGIDIPIVPGHRYLFYIFGQPGSSTGYNGMNLFFNANNTTPGISVFGATNSSTFAPDSSSTLTLQGTSATGSGHTFYTSGDVTVVLTGYSWNLPATPPGDVCQTFTFAPGDEACFFGSFSLESFPAATLTTGEPGGSPGSTIALTGSGFDAFEVVGIYGGSLGTLLGTATTNSTGYFSTTVVEPEQPYGVMNFFGLGHTSGDLGVATLSVTPSLTMTPASVEPGGDTSVEGLGFGAGETVDIYLDEPRVLLGSAAASSLGGFAGSKALTVTIPSDAQVGTNGLLGIGQTTGAIGIGKITVK